jgi:hypothetical protein
MFLTGDVVTDLLPEASRFALAQARPQTSQEPGRLEANMDEDKTAIGHDRGIMDLCSPHAAGEWHLV